MRRRDPVKRALIIGGVLVAGMLAWSTILWMKALAYKTEMASTQKIIELHSSEHKEVLNNLKQSDEIMAKINSLDKLATNRFLVANLLDAMQRATMDNIRLVRLRLDQSLTFVEEVKPSAATPKKPAKPATVTQRILLSLDARDSSAKPGDLIPKFQQLIADASYFQLMLDKSDAQRVHLKDGSYGQVQLGQDNKPFQPFTLECRFPEKTR